MANRTVKDAKSVKGTNPQYLVEKITRSRIYESRYWKEECFALSAELLVDKAMELRFIGGTFGGNIKPSPFLCLLLKMLQIQPEKDIIIEFIKNEDFKYVRCLGATYMRLIGESLDVYKYLEPLYNDYRKIRRQDKTGTYCLSHVDEFIDELLNEERVCDIILPRVQKRHILEETEQLEPRVSPLEEDLDDMEDSSDDDLEIPEIQRSPEHHRSSHHDQDRTRRSPSPRHRRSRSRSPRRRSPKRRSPSPKRERERRRSRSPRKDRERDRERRSRSRERRHRSPDRGHHREDREREERRNYHRDDRDDGRGYYRDERDEGRHHRHRSTSPEDRYRRSYRK